MGSVLEMTQRLRDSFFWLFQVKLFVKGIDLWPISSRKDEELVVPCTLEETGRQSVGVMGPNGFSMAFFQDNQDLIKGDLGGGG